ncbi:peptidoglycan D,D-transpeptidase FtsI family protein [Brevibacterium album]|uniref:peptidoglycan D,D-transpeptidase FtsI family protein n=1 Tax=Brevibacterium album TaxID=417948 RepID=UPI00041DE299|nr:penicillin-binding protein 2 [Brevibacterium album]
MRKPLRHVALVGLVMFALLFGSTSYVQFFAAPSLNENPLNSRSFYAELTRERGPILVDGTPIAYSVPSDDSYRFQRTYGAEGMPAEQYAALTGYFSITSGSSGLERAQNGMLSGTDDALFYDRIRSALTGEEPVGAAVELTIDPEAQRAAWEGLGGQHGAVAAVNPQTGEILAMVSTPGWDPNALASHDSEQAQTAYDDLIGNEANPGFNRAIGGNLYPPGSTFKVITAAAALESGDYTKDSELSAPDELDLPQTSATIRNAGGASCGNGQTATLEHSLVVSCNTSFAQLGMDLGADALDEQARKFGFGQDLDIPLRVTPSSFPAEADAPQTAQSALGQFEVRATPLQMAMVASGVANDGVVMQPQLIDNVRNSRTLDTIHESSPREFSRALSSENAQQLQEMMVEQVRSGTGTVAQIPGVDVGAKTGTAQHAEGAAPHAWFTAFAPADDPQVAVAVVVENGGNAGSEASGARVAGPIAKSVMEAVISE